VHDGDALRLRQVDDRHLVEQDLLRGRIEVEPAVEIDPLVGRTPKPVEVELNRTLRLALDDALFGRVLTTWAYTLQCYFPDLSASPPD
jgi:hypothetical protein